MDAFSFMLLVCLVSFFFVWLANQLVGLLFGEHPKDTGRLWVDTLFGTQGLHSGSRERRLMLVIGAVSVIWWLVHHF